MKRREQKQEEANYLTPHAARIAGHLDWISFYKNQATAMAYQATTNNRDEGGGANDEESVLRLRWNSHVESLQQLFESLLEQQLFVDVTLACEGGSLKAHRVMLSACSTYFRRVLQENGSKNPVIIMRDVSYAEMDFILQFIYRGEIHVPEARLPSLLKTARLLEIRGLSDKLDKPYEEPAPSEPESRKRRNSEVAANGHHNSPPHTPTVNGKAKKPTQIVKNSYTTIILFIYYY